MSINITVHQNPVSSSRDKLFYNEKDEFEKRRKLRLVQVRQQSKAIAAQVRENYKKSKDEELANIERTKNKELDEWKRRNLYRLQEKYKKSIENVGDAHKAAEECEKCEVWYEEKKAMEQAVAQQRGRDAGAKLARTKQQQEIKKKRKQVVVSKPGKSIGIQVDPPPPADKPSIKIMDGIDDDSTSIDSLILDKDDNLVISSDEEEKDTISTVHYNPQFFSSESPQNNINMNANENGLRKPFTEVSDYLKRRRQLRDHLQLIITDDLDDIEPRKIPKGPEKVRNQFVQPPKTIVITRQQSSTINPGTTISSAKSRTTTVETGPTSLGSSSGQPQKVQYYDSITTYRKEYSAPENVVQNNGKQNGEMNAIKIPQVEETKARSRSGTRDKSSEKSKSAYEKTQMRKDYDKLIEQLDSLRKTESRIKAAAEVVPRKPSLTDDKIRKNNEDREKRLNEAVEDLIHKRVLITCPPVRNQETIHSDFEVEHQAGINVASKRNKEQMIPTKDINSSDSCSSIVLGYAMPAEEDKKLEDAKKLRELLQKVSDQKKLLETTVQMPNTDENLNEKLCKKQDELRNERKILDIKEKELNLKEQQNELDKKWKELQKREDMLKEAAKKSKKTPAFLVKTMAAASEDTVDDSTTISEDFSRNEAPIVIVNKIYPKGSKKKKAKTKSKEKVTIEDTKEDTNGKVYPRTPYKVKVPMEKPIFKDQAVQSSPVVVHGSPINSTTSTASTVYRNLPEKIENAMTKKLNEMTSESKKIHKKNFDPHLMQYITRLLGMSRQSIDQLGVSSTTMETPTDSVVNISSNRTQDEDVALSFDEARRDKLQKFIDDNYAFLNDIEQTLNSSNLNGTVDENVDKVKDIWMETLSKKEKEMKKTVPMPILIPKVEPKTVPMPILLPKVEPKTVPMPILLPKNEPKTPPRLKKTSDPIVKSISESKPIISTKTTAKKEKKVKVQEPSLKSIVKKTKTVPLKFAKIITPAGHVELINLSDHSEKEILDKYDELAENSSKRISDLSEMILKVREEKKKLYENSLSSSERQNSTEYMDYPKPPRVETSPASIKDDPVSEEIHDIFLVSQRMIGMSKDSGIAMSRPVTGSDFRDSPDTRTTEFEPLLKDIPRPSMNRPASEPIEPKSKRPPTAIKRFSPQLEDGVAHELSTIGEVETLLEESHLLNPERFPDFEEHMERNAKNSEQTDTTGSQLKFDLTGMTEAIVDYQKYPDGSPDVNLTKNDKNETEIVNITGTSSFLNFQKFPDGSKLHFTNENITNSGSSSNSSLPDIVTEIKRRNIANHSFRNSLDDSNISSSPQSGSKRTPSKKKHSKTRESRNIYGIFSLDCNSISDGTETLKENLSQMGLNWASTMMKKNQEAQAGSSSSSISIVEELKRTPPQKKVLSSTKNNDECGKPLDLKEFMLRALMERTSNSDTLTSNSSITSSIVKSLLSNINTSGGSPGLLNTQGTDKNIQRTSTPVATKSSNSTQIEGISLNNVTQGLFSGESHLSSVHFTSDTDHNNDKLTIPNLKLDTEKFKSTSSSSSK